MSPRLLLLLTLAMPGCLTVSSASSSLERRSGGLQTMADPEGEHLVVQELGQRDGQLELQVSVAQRELEVERYEVYETTTEQQGWKPRGRAGRNLLWLASAAAGWVGAYGVSWGGGDDRVQIGGLGADAARWQGAVGLVAALGGLATGTQQTLAVKRPGSSTTTLLRSKRQLVSSRSLDLAPLAEGALNLALSGDGLLSTRTDAQGLAQLSGTALPLGSWREGLSLDAADLSGSWQPSDGLRSELLQLPADWSTPFHGSVLGELSSLAHEVEEGRGGGDLPLAELRSPEGARAQLEALPLEEQAPQARAWLMELEPLAMEVAAQRARIHLDWLRAASRNARQMATGVGASLVGQQLPPDMITPLFEPMDLFRQLPEDAQLSVDILAAPSRVPGPTGRAFLLEQDACRASDELGPQLPGRTVLACVTSDGSVALAIVASEQDLHLAEARAWALVAAPVAPLGLDREGRSRWIPTLQPLYAASLFVNEEGVGFTQLLDEEGLVGSGVLLRIAE